MNTPNHITKSADTEFGRQPSDCPDASRLWLLLRDELAPEDDLQFSKHVENCRRCQHELNRLSEEDHVESSQLPNVAGYRLEMELGRGAAGVVYLGRRESDQKLVAIKLLTGQMAQSFEGRRRFEQEITALRRLEHPGIVRILDWGQAQGQPYFAMTFIAGTTLGAQIANQPQPEHHCAQFIAILAEIIQSAHDQNIVHRDLKPENVLLIASHSEQAVSLGTNSTIRYEPRIVDFGIAKLLDDKANKTQTGALLGTLEYMAPEQLRGDSAITPASDVYALGAILYKLLTGVPPHRAATFPEMMHNIQHEDPAPLRSLVPGVSPAIELICSKCLQKLPSDRYMSARALAEDLRLVLSGRPPNARPIPWRRRAALWARRRPATVAILSAVFLGIIYSVGGLAAFAQQQRQNAIVVAAERDEVKKNFQTSLDAYRMLVEDIERLAEGWGLDRNIQQEQTERIVEFFEPLLARDTANTEYRTLLANAWHYRGRIPHDADPLGADSPASTDIVEAYQHCVNHCSVLLTDPANRTRMGPLKANTLNNLANIYRSRQNWDRAAILYEQAVSEWDDLIKFHPKDGQYRLYRANAIGNWSAMEFGRLRKLFGGKENSLEERHDILSPVLIRLRGALAEFANAFKANPALRNGWALRVQSKHYSHLVDLLLLEQDAPSCRDALKEWLAVCSDDKTTHLEALPRMAKLFALTAADDDRDLLFAQIDEAEKSKVFLDPDAISRLDDSAFDSVRTHVAFQKKVRRLKKTGNIQTDSPK